MEVTDDCAMCGLLLLQGKCQAGSFDLHGWIWRQHTWWVSTIMEVGSGTSCASHSAKNGYGDLQLSSCKMAAFQYQDVRQCAWNSGFNQIQDSQIECWICWNTMSQYVTICQNCTQQNHVPSASIAQSPLNHGGSSQVQKRHPPGARACQLTRPAWPTSWWIQIFVNSHW